MKQRRNKVKKVQKFMILCALFAGVMAMAMPQAALAAGTASGTDITNQATATYSVGGSAQTPVLSNSTTFKVDNKVDLVVAEVSSGYTEVNPNTIDQVLVFSVSNTGNTTQDFGLAAAANPADPFGGTENFDANVIRVFVESGVTPGFQGAEDTATYIDELPVYVNPGDEVTVYILGNIPVGQNSGDIAAYTLTAEARAGGGVGLGIALTETVGADDPLLVDIVFGDGTGATDDDRDAAHSATDAFRVLAAQLTITKTSTVIMDPFNDNVFPKHIPGAYIQYVITITNQNTATAPATLTLITDTLDANTAFDPDLIDATTGAAESVAGSGFRVDLAGSTRALNGTPQYFTTTSSVDGVDHDGSATGGIITATMVTVLPVEAGPGYAAGELKAGESVNLTFNVIIQ